MNETRDVVLGNLVSAVNMLQTCPEFTLLIPEVRVNLAYALADAKTPQEVAAVLFRVTARNEDSSLAGLTGARSRRMPRKVTGLLCPGKSNS